MKISRRGAVAPFHAMEVLKAANALEATGRRVVHMELGEPITGAPAPVRAAATAALNGEIHLGYTEALGLPALRGRIAAHYRATYGLAIPIDRIAATTGSSGGFLLAFLGAFDVGDRVALAAPSYPAYRNILSALGIEPVILPADATSGFQPTPELLEGVTGRVDGLLVASPANPTGSMVPRDDFRTLIAYCAARDIRVISDEIYHGITFGPAADCALAFDDGAIVINSFSKYFCMTGWRLGWMIIPAELRRPIERLAQSLYISPPALAQHAGCHAFACGAELDANVARYRCNRAVLLAALPRAGFGDIAPADGAFYIYADVSRLTNDSADFCQRMLTEAAVAATPGIDFDTERGHRYVRLCFAGHTADVEEAAERLVRWLA